MLLFKEILRNQSFVITDKEIYPFAKIKKIPFRCFKYVTDYVGHNYQAEIWNKRVSNGISDIVTALSL